MTRPQWEISVHTTHNLYMAYFEVVNMSHSVFIFALGTVLRGSCVNGYDWVVPKHM